VGRECVRVLGLLDFWGGFIIFGGKGRTCQKAKAV
jgi:hypothetical protein